MANANPKRIVFVFFVLKYGTSDSTVLGDSWRDVREGQLKSWIGPSLHVVSFVFFIFLQKDPTIF